MDATEDSKEDDGRIAEGVLGLFVLMMAGVAFFRRKRTLISTTEGTSEEWEDCIGT